MERVLELEREHVELYDELLKALDTLYLLQQGYRDTNDREIDTRLGTRRQLQLSMEKSAAILRAIQRLSKLHKNPNDGIRTTEDLLASRLGTLMEHNYKLDYKVKELIQKEEIVNQGLRQERTRYFKLVAQMQEISDKIHERKRASTADARSPLDGADEQSINDQNEQSINDQNEQIQELLLALKIHGGYDPMS